VAYASRGANYRMWLLAVSVVALEIAIITQGALEALALPFTFDCWYIGITKDSPDEVVQGVVAICYCVCRQNRECDLDRPYRRMGTDGTH